MSVSIILKRSLDSEGPLTPEKKVKIEGSSNEYMEFPVAHQCNFSSSWYEEKKDRVSDIPVPVAGIDCVVNAQAKTISTKNSTSATFVITPENSPEKPLQNRPYMDINNPISPNSKRAYEQYKLASNTKSPESIKIFNRVKNSQRKLGGQCKFAFDIPCSSDNPQLLVMQDSLHVVKKPAGAGAQAEAVFAQKIPFNGNGMEEELIKFSKRQSFKDQKKALDAINGKTLDTIHEFGKTLEGKNYAIFTPSSGDITHVNYKDLKSPVAFISCQLIGCAKGIQDLHNSNILHRDIKGPNLLFNLDGKGKVTDTGLMCKVPEGVQYHPIGMTPDYAPSFIWENISKQRVMMNNKITSHGLQTKAGDIFSFGVTIQKDVVEKVIKDLSEKYAIDNPLDNGYNEISGPFSGDDMVMFDKANPGRVIYLRSIPARGIEERLRIFSTREKIHDDTMVAISKLEGHILDDELKGLQMLTTLAFELQNSNPEQVPLIDEVIERLKNIGKLSA